MITIKMTDHEARALLRVVANGNASSDTESSDRTACTWVANRILTEVTKSKRTKLRGGRIESSPR